jgi:hypothetical protein
VSESEKLKKDLATHVLYGPPAWGASCASAGEAGQKEPSVALVLRPGAPPRAVLTDERGVVTEKALSYVDLLATLDHSAVVTQLRKEAVREHELPELPPGALLVSVAERPSASTFTVTGHCPPTEHLFTLEEGGTTSTHGINLPPLVWRAVWDDATGSLQTLSLTVASPELEGEPTAATDIYSWPFSNVYYTFGGALEGVCWPGKGSVSLALSQIPEMVRRFASVPNDAGRYSGDLRHNAPISGYRAFLEAIEEHGAIPHEWLVPCAMTARDLHHQRRTKG